jgi:hypothetical protein
MIKEAKSDSVGVSWSALGAIFLFAIFCCLAATMVATATATDFQALAEQGYRWVLVNGPYASPNKAAAAKLAAAKGSATSDVEFLEKSHAYFLLPGEIVFVLENDSAAGLSRIRAAGIVVDLWTETRYLSARPMKDSYGIIETPEGTGLTQPSSASPSPSTSPILESSPTPSTRSLNPRAQTLEPPATNGFSA